MPSSRCHTSPSTRSPPSSSCACSRCTPSLSRASSRPSPRYYALPVPPIPCLPPPSHACRRHPMPAAATPCLPPPPHAGRCHSRIPSLASLQTSFTDVADALIDNANKSGVDLTDALPDETWGTIISWAVHVIGAQALTARAREPLPAPEASRHCDAVRAVLSAAVVAPLAGPLAHSHRIQQPRQLCLLHSPQVSSGR